MREVPETSPAPGIGSLRIIGASLVAGVLGTFAGAVLFPVVKTEYVEKPVEVIKYVERVVEKRVEVPVERVIERRIEVPVEKVIHRATEGEPELLDRGHLSLRAGMTRSQVASLIGRPYFDDGRGDLHYYSVYSRLHVRLKFSGDKLVEIIHP